MHNLNVPSIFLSVFLTLVADELVPMSFSVNGKRQNGRPMRGTKTGGFGRFVPISQTQFGIRTRHFRLPGDPQNIFLSRKSFDLAFPSKY